MRNESMALTYAFVLGLEAVTAFVLSVWLLGESASLARISGIVLCRRWHRPAQVGHAVVNATV